MPAKSKAKITGTRAQRRAFLATQKASPAHQIELLASDYTELERLLDDAATINRDEYEAAKLVGQLRTQLQGAEFRLATVRNQAREIHVKLAPLWHRLPA